MQPFPDDRLVITAFLAEARATARCRHDDIVEIRAAGVPASLFVFEYLHGADAAPVRGSLANSTSAIRQDRPGGQLR